MQAINIQKEIKESLAEAAEKANLLRGNFLNEIEWLLKNVTPQNFESFDNLVPVARLSSGVQKAVGVKENLVYIKPKVYAKIRGWWEVFEGHPQINPNIFWYLPYFIHFPIKILAGKVRKQNVLLVGFTQHYFVLVLERPKKLNGKNEVVTIFPIRERGIKSYKEIVSFDNKKMGLPAGTAVPPILAPTLHKATRGGGSRFSTLQTTQQNTTISVKKSQVLKFYEKVNKETKVDLLYFPKKLNSDDIHLEHPADPAHGDYATNIALTLFGQLKSQISNLIRQLADQNHNLKLKIFKSPTDLATYVVEQFPRVSYLEKIEVVAPGFINFWLSKEFLISQLQKIISVKTSLAEAPCTGRKYMVEFAHPNTLKPFHIGHLRNISLGESIVRLLESQGVSVVRANYQGDVGLHIAKALWAFAKVPAKGWSASGRKSLKEKIEFLGKAYTEGNKVYEEVEKAKEEITALNKKIYEKDQGIMPLWQETREWSLDYFEQIYKRVGTHFDRYFFESEVADSGKKIVLENLAKGVFEKSERAVIFDGEKFGLHKRVFISKDGFPTYEAKDLGLARLQFSEYNIDKCIHVVGPEQKDYFAVVFKALEVTEPRVKGKEEHLMYGWVRLKEGKMSSRAGSVITASSLLDEIKKKVFAMIDVNKEYEDVEKEEITEKVTIAAAKYSLLKFAPKTEIVFDIEESISLTGNSGPYLQYTYARTQSVMRKVQSSRQEGGQAPFKVQNGKKTIQQFNPSTSLRTGNLTINPEETIILRTLYKFSEVVTEAAKTYAPNLICNFLFDLAQKFNTFYERCPIIKAENEEARDLRLALTAAVGQVIKDGLYLLGIEAPERM